MDTDIIIVQNMNEKAITLTPEELKDEAKKVLDELKELGLQTEIQQAQENQDHVP